ncbi:MAG: NAD-dependent epimerase/dehydratase family protein [Bacteroidetes bacterium]|nr:NAD-dependent epimerase/dehydratase family protein [Bacteroidota bacterium]
MKKILVTGARGFMGRRLVERLTLLGKMVIGIDKEDGDIANEDALGLFEKEDISYVFHLAGKTFVPDSWKNPSEFYRVNVLGTQNVLDFCRKTGAMLTYVSSYVYGTPQYLPIDETHPLNAYNPYSHTKILAEEVCGYYRDQFGVQMTILRPFNAYGPGQSEPFLIPELIRKIFDKANPIIEVSDTRPKRDYIFIDDLVDALLLSMDGPKGIYNVGSGYSVSVGELIDLLSNISGVMKVTVSANAERPLEIFDLFADVSKITDALKWQPKTGLGQGLAACIKGYSG